VNLCRYQGNSCTWAVPSERVFGLRQFLVDVDQLVLNERVLDLQHGPSYPVVEVHGQLQVDDELAQLVAPLVQFKRPVWNVLIVTTLHVVHFLQHCHQLHQATHVLIFCTLFTNRVCQFPLSNGSIHFRQRAINALDYWNDGIKYRFPLRMYVITTARRGFYRATQLC